MIAPCIGLTLGDPGGVGPEIVIKAAAVFRGIYPDLALIIIGDAGLLGAEIESLGIDPGAAEYPGPDAVAGIYVHHVPSGLKRTVKGRPDAENGAASFRFFEEAVEMARSGEIGAMVTAPVAKSSWHMAGIPWRGHTEYLAKFYPTALMTFWSERLKVALFSHHLPLAEAIGLVKRDKLTAFLENLDRSLARGASRPREFLVAGLNPHAGEDGVLGREEKDEITPALDKAREAGLSVSGPYPPDTVFLKALDDPGAMVVALYHDQGLIGFKLLSFVSGVNATLGLPYVRTSPDHGTAFDIAGRGVADESSMLAAIDLAVNLSGLSGGAGVV